MDKKIDIKYTYVLNFLVYKLHLGVSHDHFSFPSHCIITSTGDRTARLYYFAQKDVLEIQRGNIVASITRGRDLYSNTFEKLFENFILLLSS